MRVLGISCYFHDAAVCLLEDGAVVAAAQEERFTRTKHDPSFPERALRYCLEESPGEIDAVAFYDKPVLKFHRLLETYLSVAPAGLRSFLLAIPPWMRVKLWIDPEIRAALQRCGVRAPERIHFPEHHLSHAASAFYPSPFPDAAVLTIDGVGEWATATVACGEDERIEILEQLSFPHSLGLLYSAFTTFLGFRVNSAEYKVMGLAPYGRPTYVDRILEHLLDLREDGSFRLATAYFGYLDDLVMTSPRFDELFDGPPRRPGSPITRRELDLARSIQEVTEQVVLRMARHARVKTGKRRLCLAGGVALNCTANARLLRSGLFEELWIQPAAGDAGGALGAALAVWHGQLGHKRVPDGVHDGMHAAFLGPEFTGEQIRRHLDGRGSVYEVLSDEERPRAVASLLARGKVVGLFQGRMEFGPRALGNRSILADPRDPGMQARLNRKIKFRESFRPFAPSCLEECAAEWFDFDRLSPYMLFTAPVAESKRCEPEEPGARRDDDLGGRLAARRSEIPAVTHVDGSARLQTVSADVHPELHRVISCFRDLTGVPVVINTSFNVRGEPIVCTPADALDCFLRTEMDALCLGPCLLHRAAQPEGDHSRSWRRTIRLD